MASPAASSPSPHPHSSPGSAARTSPPRRSSSLHPHSAPDSTARPPRLADWSSPSPHLHSTPDSAASTSPSRRADSVRVYALRDSCLEFIAELGRTGGARDAAQVREQAPTDSEEPGEVVLAFLSSGTICGLAYLSPDAPRLVPCASDDDDDEEEEDVDDDDEEEEDFDDDEDEDDDAASASDDDASDDDASDDDASDDDDAAASILSVTDESSNNESSNDKDNDDKDKQDGDYGWGCWEVDDAEKQESKSEPAYSLKLKVWPSSGYANIVLYDGKAWISTTNYSFSWLSRIDTQIMMEKLAEPSQVDMKVIDLLLVSNAMLLRSSEYEGAMVNSAAVEIFVKFNLRPRLCNFNVHDILGKGAFCNVRLCTVGDQTGYAMKIIKCEGKIDLNEPREIAIHSSLKSPHVVKFLQAWTESSISVSYEDCSSSDISSQIDDSRESWEAPRDMQRPRYILILMELCEGTLADYFSTESCELDAEKSLHIFKEIVQGVQYVHGQNVIHRDLKPNNIFKGKDNKFKLGDFGQSRVQPMYIVSFKGTPYLGTIFYAAPELKKGESISDKVDIYPLGVIYFELFNIFNTAMAKSKLFMEFKDDDGSEITWEGDFCLFKQMIAFDPVKRPSINDVLEHISQVRSSLQKAEASYMVNGLDQPGQSEQVNVAENRDSIPTEEADTPRGETRA